MPSPGLSVFPGRRRTSQRVIAPRGARLKGTVTCMSPGGSLNPENPGDFSERRGRRGCDVGWFQGEAGRARSRCE